MKTNSAQLDPSILMELTAVEGIGTLVRYWPIWKKECQSEFVDVRTTSHPWMLGHGEWVVNVEGKSGGQAVSHMRLITPQQYHLSCGPGVE